ncbi:MAG: 30S ribosomal protein S5 [bacterium]|nr:30S ribosomal protein S5 [bacterium]
MARHFKEKEKSEYDQVVIDMRRVARVVAGGRRFSFRATVVVGNRRGKVGIGVGKGADVKRAVEKAAHRGKKHIMEVRISKNGTISQAVTAKYASAKVLLKPAPPGSGIIAGGPVRTVCSLAGIENISSKILGRTVNKLNNARATIEAFKKLK